MSPPSNETHVGVGDRGWKIPSKKVCDFYEPANRPERQRAENRVSVSPWSYESDSLVELSVITIGLSGIHR